MKRFVLIMMLTGCHAHQVQQNRQTMESPPTAKEIQSARPVRTTPGGMLDKVSVEKIQRALVSHGETVNVSGRLDGATQSALKKFQRRQSQPATGFPDFDTLRRLGLSAKDIYLGGTHRRDAEKQ